MPPIPRRKHTALIADLVPLSGRRVADIGCGDGALVRYLARQGAKPIGIEVSPKSIGRARAAPAAGGEHYCVARGEALPFEAGSLDVVIYFNSLHHLPVEAMAAGLAEATRVLRSGGRLYVMEPLAEGGFFELIRPIEDETAVRAAAYAALCALRSGPDHAEEAELVYDAAFKHADFAAFCRNVVAVDPRRAPVVAAREAELRQGFEALAERRDDGCWFVQPSRVNLLRRL